MNCYKHKDEPAIGVCKHCQKGLCIDCRIDTGDGLSCQGHEEAVNALNQLIKQNLNKQAAPINLWIIPIFLGFTGSTFVITALTSQHLGRLPLMIGAGFMLLGLMLLIRNRQIFTRH